MGNQGKRLKLEYNKENATDRWGNRERKRKRESWASGEAVGSPAAPWLGGQNYTALVHLQVLLHSYTIIPRHLIMHTIFTVDYSMHLICVLAPMSFKHVPIHS